MPSETGVSDKFASQGGKSLPSLGGCQSIALKAESRMCRGALWRCFRRTLAVFVGLGKRLQHPLELVNHLASHAATSYAIE
jgi:hypothetical protein